MLFYKVKVVFFFPQSPSKSKYSKKANIKQNELKKKNNLWLLGMTDMQECD